MKTNKYSAKAARVGTTPKHVLAKQKKACRTFDDEYTRLLAGIEEQNLAWRREAYGHYDLVFMDELTADGKLQRSLMERIAQVPVAIGMGYGNAG